MGKNLKPVEIDAQVWARLCAKLGLPTDASVDDFDTALQALLDQVDGMNETLLGEDN